MKLLTVALSSNPEGLTTLQWILSAALIVGLFIFSFLCPKLFKKVDRLTGHEPAKKSVKKEAGELVES